jgi:hypothetical protein
MHDPVAQLSELLNLKKICCQHCSIDYFMIVIFTVASLICMLALALCENPLLTLRAPVRIVVEILAVGLTPVETPVDSNV